MHAFSYIDMSSFWSLWYWALTVVAWSMTAHWTIGVPFDAIIRADRKGGIFAEHCDTLVEINVYRLIYLFEVGGIYLTGGIGFVLAVVGTLGFVIGIEVFMALFMLMVPLTIAMAFSMKFAYRVRAMGWQGGELRKKMRWRRFWNQIIGMLGIIAASIASMWFFLYSLGYM